jgi:hypothetical protein
MSAEATVTRWLAAVGHAARAGTSREPSMVMTCTPSSRGPSAGHGNQDRPAPGHRRDHRGDRVLPLVVAHLGGQLPDDDRHLHPVLVVAQQEGQRAAVPVPLGHDEVEEVGGVGGVGDREVAGVSGEVGEGHAAMLLGSAERRRWSSTGPGRFGRLTVRSQAWAGWGGRR